MLTGWLLVATLREDGIIASSIEKNGSWVAPQRRTAIFWAKNTLTTHPIKTQVRWLLPILESKSMEIGIKISDYLELIEKQENLFLPFVAGFRNLNQAVKIEDGGDLISIGCGEGPCLRTSLKNLTDDSQRVIRQLLNIDIIELHRRIHRLNPL